MRYVFSDLEISTAVRKGVTKVLMEAEVDLNLNRHVKDNWKIPMPAAIMVEDKDNSHSDEENKKAPTRNANPTRPRPRMTTDVPYEFKSTIEYLSSLSLQIWKS